MENKKAYVRRTICVSQYVSNMLDVLSDKEFSGNMSALVAHLVLQYATCQRCAINNTINITQKNTDKTGNNAQRKPEKINK